MQPTLQETPLGRSRRAGGWGRWVRVSVGFCSVGEALAHGLLGKRLALFEGSGERRAQKEHLAQPAWLSDGPMSVADCGFNLQGGVWRTRQPINDSVILMLLCPLPLPSCL